MSEEKKADLQDLFSTSDDITGEQLLYSLNIKDDNIALKTRIKQPTVVMAVELIQKISEKRDLKNTAELLKNALQSYRENFISLDGLSRDELVKSWVALMEANQRRKEGLADQLFGGSRR